MDKFPNKNTRKHLSINTVGNNNKNTNRKKQNFSSSGTSSNSFQQTYPSHQPFPGANDSPVPTHHNTSLNLNSNNMLEHKQNILLNVHQMEHSINKVQIYMIYMIHKNIIMLNF